MPVYGNYTAALGPRSLDTRDYSLVDRDELRARAARYRLLAETLVDHRVIGIVQDCARELEMEAMLTATSDAS